MDQAIHPGYRKQHVRLSGFYHLFLIFFLLSCSACASSSQPAAATPTPSVGGCQATGKPRLVSSSAHLPSTQGEWPTFHGDLSRDGAVPGGQGESLTQVWTYCTGGPIFSSPVVQNGIVYIASTSQTLTALDIKSGEMIWHVRADSPFYSTPALENGILYAAALDGSLYAIDAASGRIDWQSRIGITGAKFWSSPAVADGLVLIGVASALNERPKVAGQLLAFDARTGAVRWRAWTLAQGMPGGGIWSSPAIDPVHGIVYAATGDPDDGVQAFTLQTGQLLWHWRSVVRDVADTDVGAGPALYQDQQGNGRVAVGGKDGYMYSLDARTGQVVWRTRVGAQVYSSPAFARGTLYAVGTLIRRATAWALSAGTGAPLWQHSVPLIVYASPAISGQTLYLAVGDAFGSGDGGIEVVDAATGQLVQFADIRSPASSSPAVLAGWVFVGAGNGNLYAFTR